MAGPIAPWNGGTVDFNSVACANYGDFQSCSAQYLNFVVTGSVTGNATTDYVHHAPQGALQDALVIFSNGAPIDNTDIGTNIDNAYNALISGSETVYGTSIGAGEATPPPGGEISDPETVVSGEVAGVITGVNGGGAAATAWDIGLAELVTALTLNGTRRDMYIFFDNNQDGVTQSQNLLISALVCVQDNQNVLADRCFELVDQNGTFNQNPNPNPTTFSTLKSYGDPLADNPFAPANGPVMANGTFCVDNTTKQVVAFNVQSSNDCPANSTFINNNLGTNESEFIALIPELNASLEQLLAQGYDLVSFQVLMTNQSDGFEDIYILAGPIRTTQVPEPGTLLLIGLGLLGLTRVVRRTKE